MESCKILLDDDEIYPFEEKRKYPDAQYICQLRFNGHLATIKSKEQYEQVKSSLKKCNTKNDEEWIVGVKLDGKEGGKYRWADGSEFNLDSNKHLFLEATNFSLLKNSCRVPYMTTHPVWNSIYLSTKNNCDDEFNFLCTTHPDIVNFSVLTTEAPVGSFDPSNVLVPLVTVFLIAVFGVIVYRREQKKKRNRNKSEVEMKENVIYGVNENVQHCEMKDNVLYGETCPQNLYEMT